MPAPARAPRPAERVSHTACSTGGARRALQPLRRAPQPAGGGHGVGGSGRRVGRGRAAAHIDALLVCTPRFDRRARRGASRRHPARRSRRANARLGTGCGPLPMPPPGGARHRPRRQAPAALLVALARLLVPRAAPRRRRRADRLRLAAPGRRMRPRRRPERASTLVGKICTLSRPWRRALSAHTPSPHGSLRSTPPAPRNFDGTASGWHSVAASHCERLALAAPMATSGRAASTGTQMHHEPTDARHSNCSAVIGVALASWS